jgi:hypothetical protein
MTDDWDFNGVIGVAIPTKHMNQLHFKLNAWSGFELLILIKFYAPYFSLSFRQSNI